MVLQPGAHLGMLVGGIVVQDHKDDLAREDVALDRVQEADKFLMAVALHVLPRHRSVEHVQRREQRGGAVTLVIVRHRRAASLLHRQIRLSAIQRLDLAFLIEQEHHCVCRRSDIEANHLMELLGEDRILRQLELPLATRRKAVDLPDPLDCRGGQAHGLGHRPKRPVRGRSEGLS